MVERASCGPGEGAAAATTVLANSAPRSRHRGPGSSPLALYDEMHYVGGQLGDHRHIQTQIPEAPPGKTFVRGGRLVNRMEFDKGGVTATDLRDIWAMATEPDAWLGRPNVPAALRQPAAVRGIRPRRLPADRNRRDGPRTVAAVTRTRRLRPHRTRSAAHPLRGRLHRVPGGHAVDLPRGRRRDRPAGRSPVAAQAHRPAPRVTRTHPLAATRCREPAKSSGSSGMTAVTVMPDSLRCTVIVPSRAATRSRVCCQATSAAIPSD